MSLLSSFIAGHVVKALEQQFIEHEPEMQEAFLGEVHAFVNVVSGWIHEKLLAKESKNG